MSQALRGRHPVVLDLLAELATGRRQQSSALLDQVAAGDIRSDLVTDPDRRTAWAALALAWAGLLQERELQTASLVLEQLWPTGTMSTLAPHLQLTSLQAVFLAGRHEQLAALLSRVDHDLHPDGEHYLRTDLVNPQRAPGSPPADHAVWEGLLSTRFVEAGLAPVTVLGGSAPAFDRLAAPSAQAGSTGGDLVTVVMPCWQPDEGLITAVASIVAQTYGDLEIVVVDDASGPDHAEIFARAVDLDPRVRLLRLPRNGGAYLARAAAIDSSRGTCITFQDADDWSHPSRIEQQVAALAEHPEGSMSRSLAVRARDDLTHQWLGYRAIRPNASSLLLRRSLLDRTGGFVPVRKGADSEFAERVTVLDGPIVDVPAPLAITRLRQGSLSRGDFTFSWAAPDRFIFRESFLAWHRELARTGEPALTSAPALDPLPFPVPATWVRDLPSADQVPSQFPIGYLGNFSRSGSPAAGRWLRAEHEDPSPQAVPAALWHQEARLSGTLRPRLCRRWDPFILSGALHPVSRLETARIGRLVIIDPEVVTLMGGQPVHLHADEVEVWLTPKHVLPGPSGLPEDLLGLSDRVAGWWHVRPRWRLAPWLDDEQREVVRGALPDLELADLDPTGPDPTEPVLTPAEPAR